MSDVDTKEETTLEQSSQEDYVSSDNIVTPPIFFTEEHSYEEPVNISDNEYNSTYLNINTPPQHTRASTALTGSASSSHRNSTVGFNIDPINQLLNDPNMSDLWMRRMQATVEDLKNQIQQLREENNQLQSNLAEQQIRYETRIETAFFELSNAQIECQKYQARYQEINEEMNGLRDSHLQAQQTGEENQSIYLQLKQLNSDYIQMQSELESKTEQNANIKKRLIIYSENVNSLNLALINLTKAKSKLDKTVLKNENDLELMNKEFNLYGTQMETKLMRSEAESEFWKSQCQQSEAEKLKMQTDITQATLNLINEQESGSLNLSNEDSHHLRISMSMDDTPSSRLVSARSDMGYNFTMDEIVNNDARRRKHSDIQSGDNIQFIKQRLPSMDAYEDSGNLMQTFTEHDMHEHMRSESIGSHFSVHGRNDSSISMFVLEKFKQEFRDLLIDDIRTILNEEILNISQGPDKEEKKSQLDEESLEKMMENFEKTLKENLDELLVKQLENNEQKNQLIIKETIEQMNDSFEKENDIKEVLEETVENQMIALQMSLENEISRSVYQSVQSVVNQAINEQFRDNIKSDLNLELNVIREQLVKMQDNAVEEEEDEDEKEKGMKMDGFLEKFEKMLETQIADKMNGKIDSLMQDFRLEVVPELTAIFENLQRSSSNAESDDEKIDENRNQLKQEILNLQLQISKMEEDRMLLEISVKDVAQSKVSAVLRLQNMIDHMRYDNRMLYARIERLKNKRKQERLEAQDTIVNRMSNYFWGVSKDSSVVVNEHTNANRNIISL